MALFTREELQAELDRKMRDEPIAQPTPEPPMFSMDELEAALEAKGIEPSEPERLYPDEPEGEIERPQHGIVDEAAFAIGRGTLRLGSSGMASAHALKTLLRGGAPEVIGGARGRMLTGLTKFDHSPTLTEESERLLAIAEHPDVQASGDWVGKPLSEQISYPGFYAVNLLEMVPQLLGATVAAAAGGPAASLLFLTASEGGAHYNEARKAGASDERAAVESVFVGGINAILEYIPIAAWLDKGPAAALKKKAISAGLRMLGKAGKFAKKAASTKAGRKAIGALSQAGMEAVTEALQEATGIAANDIADRAGADFFSWATSEEMARAGILGGVMGGIMGAAPGGQSDVQEQAPEAQKPPVAAASEAADAEAGVTPLSESEQATEAPTAPIEDSLAPKKADGELDYDNMSDDEFLARIRRGDRPTIADTERSPKKTASFPSVLAAVDFEGGVTAKEAGKNASNLERSDGIDAAKTYQLEFERLRNEARSAEKASQESELTEAPTAPIAEAEVAPKVGDTTSVMGNDAKLARMETDENGIRHELYEYPSKPGQPYQGAAIRSVDVDSGEVVSLTRYPKMADALAKLPDGVKPVSEPKPKASLTKPKAEAITVYHGTSESYQGPPSTVRHKRGDYVGTYFSQTRKGADLWATDPNRPAAGRVIKAQVRLENPASRADVDAAMAKLNKEDGGWDSATLTEELKERGFDGVIDSEVRNEIVVFDDSQIAQGPAKPAGLPSFVDSTGTRYVMDNKGRWNTEAGERVTSPAVAARVDAEYAKQQAKPKEPLAQYGESNKIVTTESKDAALKSIADKMKRLHTGLPVDMVAPLVTIGVYHFEAGARTFKDWSAKMIAEVGENIKPHLKAIWDRTQTSRKALDQDGVNAQAGKDMTIPPPDSPIPAEAAPAEAQMPDVREVGDHGLTETIDKWQGDRDVAAFDHDVNMRTHRDEIAEMVGEKRYGKKARMLDEAIHRYIDLKGKAAEEIAKYGDKVSDASRAVVNRSQNLTKKETAYAERMIAENAEIGARAKDAGVIRNVHENYTARIYRFSKKSMKRVMPKFSQTTARAKQRTLTSILEAESKGYELAVPTATEAQRVAADQTTQAMLDRNLVKMALKSGIFKRSQEAGYEPLKHPGLHTWVPRANIKEEDASGLNFFTAEDGTVWERIPLYALPHIAKHLNNALGTSMFEDVGTLKKAAEVSDALKRMIFVQSFFHHQAFFRSAALAGRGFNLVKGYEMGREAIMQKNPRLRELIHAELTIGLAQDFESIKTSEKSRIEALINDNAVGHVRDFMRDMRDRHMEHLFGKIGPYLKAWTALLEYDHLLAKYAPKIEAGTMTRQQVATIVAKRVNDDFGGLNLARMGRNKTIQSFLRTFLLAPDWTESNVRSMVKALVKVKPQDFDNPTNVFRRLRLATGPEGAAYRAMWSRVALKGGAITLAANLLMASIDDEDFFERYKRAWAEGNLRWLDVDVTPIYRFFTSLLGGTPDAQRKYFSIFGHTRDPIKFAVNPVRSLKHKLHPFGPGLALEAMTGEDYAQRPFTTNAEFFGLDPKGKLAGKTVKSPFKKGGPVTISKAVPFGIHSARRFLPIPAQQLVAFLAGEVDAFDAITKAAGLMTSTTYAKGAAWGNMDPEMQTVEASVALNDLFSAHKKLKEAKREYADRDAPMPADRARLLAVIEPAAKGIMLMRRAIDKGLAREGEAKITEEQISEITANVMSVVQEATAAMKKETSDRGRSFDGARKQSPQKRRKLTLPKANPK